MKKYSYLISVILCNVLAGFSACSAEPQRDNTLLNPLVAGWEVRPLLNVGEQVGKTGYRMVGIPDGLGAMDNNDGTISIFMNHEIPSDMGVVRRHGGQGAFVSHWVLDRNTLKVVGGEDWIRNVQLWDQQTASYVAAPAYRFNRLCSADLARLSAFYDAASGKGFNGRLFLNGEEDHSGGAAFAHVVTGEYAGTSYQLPHLGRFAWENAVANPQTGVKTVVMGMDDSPGGQVYVYVGEKRSTGNVVEQAGLVGGSLYAVKVEDKRFSLVALGDVTAMNGDQLEKATRAAGATGFLRPEDGAWDPRNGKDFYFATTDKIDGSSQLFKLTFDNPTQPERGGEIKVVLNARDIGAQMFDNIVVDTNGRLLIEEDPGDNPHSAAIWLFDPASGKASKVLGVSQEHFVDKDNPEFITQDEENSGVIEVTELMRSAPWFKQNKRYYLGVIQVHAPSQNSELVQDGQLYLITGPAN